MNHLLKLESFDPQIARQLLHQAKIHKATRGRPDASRCLSGQTWGLIFSKPSTRTRLSFEVAIRELGGSTIFLNSQDMQMGRGELIADTARVMSRMLHGVVIRTFAQSDVEQLANAGNIPVINALTDDEHPCQILTDIFTYEEKRGSISGRKIVFIGDAACNVARSWVHAAEIFDFQLVCAAPKEFQTTVTNSHVTLTDDPQKAARDADLLYTDVWVSMGKEQEAAERLRILQPYQINEQLLSFAKPDALVLHCLPAYRDKEISSTLFEARSKDIFDQAENRLHTQKAILEWATG